MLILTQELKHISGRLLENSRPRIAHAPLLLWSLRTHKLSFRALQRFLGALQWLLTPNNYFSPFMSSSYALLLQCRLPILLPRNLFISLLQCELGPQFLSSAAPLPLLHACQLSFVMPLHCTRIPLWCPVASCARLPLPHTAPLWFKTQQEAEMYSAFHAIRQMVLRRHTHVCLATDNAGVFFSLLRGRSSARNWLRVTLLRRNNRMWVQCGVQIQLALICSRRNLADQFSRTADHPELFLAPPSFTPLTHFKFNRVAESLCRFWWQPSVSLV